MILLLRSFRGEIASIAPPLDPRLLTGFYFSSGGERPRWWSFLVAVVLHGSCLGGSCFRWQLSRWQLSCVAIVLGGSFSSWQLSWVAIVPGGSCPGGNCPGS